MLVDFGLRRAHGAEAALLSARASFLSGFAGTATVEAGRAFGVPVFGTMAHSYVQAHADEADAFERFARAHPENAVLLIDTYDTERGARKVAQLAARLAADGVAIKGVRIDSGDLGAHARRVRAILDAAGFPGITIFASGNLDEHRLADLVAERAPIDGFGVGTRMNTSADAPYLDCAYKLQEYEGRPRRKRSEGKATWPGSKQVWRRHDPQGKLAGDMLALASEAAPPGTAPLLVPVMREGRRVAPLPALAAARETARAERARLPEPLRSLDEAAPYAVEVTPALRALAAEIDAQT
jgi:nicotinate phosphoribosyltransferase